MKIEINIIRNWIKDYRKGVKRMRKNPAITLSKKVTHGEMIALDTLSGFLDVLDINYIDRKTARKKSIFKIADHFGVEHQCKKLEEELIECLHAIKRYNTSSIHNYDQEQLRKDLVEEMGDVRMMIMQVEYLLGIHEDVNTSIDNKIIRTFDRIESQKSSIDMEKIKEANT